MITDPGKLQEFVDTDRGACEHKTRQVGWWCRKRTGVAAIQPT